MGQIRKIDLFKVLLRSFYIQSTWNAERLLGLGFCFSIIPIARRLFSDKNNLIDFLKRHLEFFNSHPYMATFALGATASIEEQAILKNWDNKRPISVFKSRIVGPLGALGDTFFWQLIRPVLGLLAVVLLYYVGIWGTLVYFTLYNILHLGIRIRGLYESYSKGFDIVRVLSFRGTQKYFDLINYISASLMGIELVLIMNKIFQEPSSWKGIFVFVLAALVSYFLMRRKKITIDLLIVIIVCSSIIIGLVI